jgi:hypothetical protein
MQAITLPKNECKPMKVTIDRIVVDSSAVLEWFNSQSPKSHRSVSETDEVIIRRPIAGSEGEEICITMSIAKIGRRVNLFSKEALHQTRSISPTGMAPSGSPSQIEGTSSRGKPQTAGSETGIATAGSIFGYEQLRAKIFELEAMLLCCVPPRLETSVLRNTGVGQQANHTSAKPGRAQGPTCQEVCKRRVAIGTHIECTTPALLPSAPRASNRVPKQSQACRSCALRPQPCDLKHKSTQNPSCAIQLVEAKASLRHGDSRHSPSQAAEQAVEPQPARNQHHPQYSEPGWQKRSGDTTRSIITYGEQKQGESHSSAHLSHCSVVCNKPIKGRKMAKLSESHVKLFRG